MNRSSTARSYVTEDGAETDLDLGHYERFTRIRTAAREQRHRGAGVRVDLAKERAASTWAAPCR